MNLSEIDSQFEKILSTDDTGRKLRNEIGMSALLAAQYRSRLKNGVPISVEKKLRWLAKAGLTSSFVSVFSRKDVVDILRYALRAPKAAQELGADYLLEKWVAKKSNK
jgi:hypothetical protein